MTERPTLTQELVAALEKARPQVEAFRMSFQNAPGPSLFQAKIDELCAIETSIDAALSRANESKKDTSWTVFYGKPSMYPVGAPTPKSTSEPGEEEAKMSNSNNMQADTNEKALIAQLRAWALYRETPFPDAARTVLIDAADALASRPAQVTDEMVLALHDFFDSAPSGDDDKLYISDIMQGEFERLHAAYTAISAAPQVEAPNLPCPICKGVEGCDHTRPERARAAERAAAIEDGRQWESLATGLAAHLEQIELHCQVKTGTKRQAHADEGKALRETSLKLIALAKSELGVSALARPTADGGGRTCGYYIRTYF